MSRKLETNNFVVNLPYSRLEEFLQALKIKLVDWLFKANCLENSLQEIVFAKRMLELIDNPKPGFDECFVDIINLSDEEITIVCDTFYGDHVNSQNPEISHIHKLLKELIVPVEAELSGEEESVLLAAAGLADPDDLEISFVPQREFDPQFLCPIDGIAAAVRRPLNGGILVLLDDLWSLVCPVDVLVLYCYPLVAQLAKLHWGGQDWVRCDFCGAIENCFVYPSEDGTKEYRLCTDCGPMDTDYVPNGYFDLPGGE